MENNKIVDWIKAHRTELAITGVTIVGTVLVVKNWDTIKGLFKNIGLTAPKLVEVESAIEKVTAPILSSDILDNLTGKKLTARALGDKDFLLYIVWPCLTDSDVMSATKMPQIFRRRYIG